MVIQNQYAGDSLYQHPLFPPTCHPKILKHVRHGLLADRKGRKQCRNQSSYTPFLSVLQEVLGIWERYAYRRIMNETEFIIVFVHAKYISFVGVTRKTIVMRLHDMSLWKQMSTQMMFCASCSLENAICYFTSNCLFVLIQLELLVSIFFFIWKSDTFLFLALLQSYVDNITK